jgi:hypothetical protein
MTNGPSVGSGTIKITAAQERVDCLLRGGQFSQARQILGELTEPWALIERARLSLYLDNDSGASAMLSARVRSSDATPGQLLLARALGACADANRGRASASFDVADFAAVEPSLVPEIVYYIASSSYFEHDLATAEKWLDSHSPADPAWNARYLIFRGLLAGAREDFATRARLTNAALDILERDAPDHLYLIANASRLLAALVLEVPFPEGVARLERTYSRLAGDDKFIMRSRFNILRALGWSKALHGNYLDATHLIIQATEEARDKMERLYVYLDHASIAVFTHEGTGCTAQAVFAMAKEIADNISWSEIITDELEALPLAAQVSAEFGAMKDARRYCEIAISRRHGITRRLAMAHDSRFQAMIDEATALSFADIDPKRATAAAADAYETYSRIGFAWRAARMAILLLQMTRLPKWRQRAESHLESYPNSPFHRLLTKRRRLT